ncbi:MAG TPA: hypothetical protein VLW65_11030 [Bryobacteraceae bacterium]|nr:hypothetical protein [Bryobacteraceae bacterium]
MQLFDDVGRIFRRSRKPGIFKIIHPGFESESNLIRPVRVRHHWKIRRLIARLYSTQRPEPDWARGDGSRSRVFVTSAGM